jgi:hypothetical protein
MCWFSFGPKSAVDPLAQEFIDYSSLSKRERERNNFMEIKARQFAAGRKSKVMTVENFSVGNI